MSRKTATIYSDMFRPHLFQGQFKGKMANGNHFDARRYTMNLRESYVLNYIDRTGRKKGVFESNFVLKRLKKLEFEGTRLGLLMKIFRKYLNLRFPTQGLIFEQSTTFIVAAILSFLYREDEEFRPEHLWNFMARNSKIDFLFLLQAASHVFFLHANLKPDEASVDARRICYFGEFLYYCSIVDKDRSSIVALIRENSPEEVATLIDEISMEVTPELGILVFVAFRNWVMPFDTKYRRLCFHYSKFSSRVKYFIQSSYQNYLLLLYSDKELAKYLAKVFDFLNSEISGASIPFVDSECIERYHCVIENSLVTGYDYDQCVVDYLMFVEKCIMDIILFLRSILRPKTLPFCGESFKDLPLFIQFNRKYKICESASVMIFACSKLLDFWCVDNWNKGVYPEYLEVCREMELSIKRFYPEHLVICREFSLFPFFR